MEEEELQLMGTEPTNPIFDKLKKIAETNPNLENEVPSALEGQTDLTGLGRGQGKFDNRSIPKYYEDIGNKLGWSPFSLPQDMEKEAYLGQSGVEVFSNTVKGFGTQALAGAIDSMAAWDMEGLYDMASGNTEKEYGNWLNEVGKDLREFSQENHQIYKDGDSMWNSSYWAGQIQSLGYTGGIIAEMIGEQVALAYLTGGSGNAPALASKARLMKMGGQGMFGMWKGVQEGYMNALETSENVYQKYKDLGYDDEAATKKASEAASLGFRAEVGPLAALNALQFMTTFGVAKSAFNKASGPNLGFSGGVETLIDKALPNINNKWAKAGAGFALNAASEGVEEGIQTGVGKYAEHEILKSTGDSEGDLNIWDSEMRDSMIGGVLGGGLFSGAGKLLEPYTKGTAAKQYSRAHDKFLSEAVSRASSTFEQQSKVADIYTEAEQTYKKDRSKRNLVKLQEAQQAVREAQYNVQLANTVNALQLDYITGNTTAYESHVEQMQNILDAVNNGNVEDLKKYGILDQSNKERFKGSIDTIKNTFEQNIKDSEFVKNSLENNLLNITSDFESAYGITKKEYINLKNIETISSYNNALDLMYNKDNQYNQLSSNAKERFQLETELEALNRFNNPTESNLNRKQEIQEDLKELGGYSSKDKRIVSSIAKSPYVSAHGSIISTQQYMDDINKELSELRNPKNINKNINKRKKDSIQKSQSKEEVDSIVKEAEDDGVVTDEIIEQAEAKKSQISAQDTIKKTNPKFIPKQDVNIEEGIKDIQEEDKTSEDLLSQMLSSGKLSSSQSDSEQAFSPKEFNLGSISEEQLSQIKDIHEKIANNLDTELKRPAQFEDFIKDKIEKTSFDNVDNMFEAYKFAWQSIGRDISNAMNVYNDTFNLDTMSEDILSQFISQEDKIKQSNDIIDTSIEEKSKTIKFNLDNRPVDKDGNYSKDGRTGSPKPKAAHLGIQYKEVKNSDNTISRIPVLPQLNESQQIRNHYLLDPGFVKEDTELEVSVPQDVNNIKVADWNFIDNKWQKSEITFGQWVSKNNVQVGSKQYNSKVPMIASIGEDNIFFLHDTDWYNTSNIAATEDQIDVIRKGKEDILSIREQVLSGNSSIKIEERNFGSIFKLNTLQTNNEPISLSEATGDTLLTVASSYTELSDSTSSTNGPVNSKLNLVNNLEKNSFDIGQIYEIREVNNGQHIALPVLTNDISKGELLNDVAYNNVKYSLIASVLLNGQATPSLVKGIEEKFGLTISKAKDIQGNIKSTTGLDIKFDIGDYMSMFVRVDQMNSKMISKLEDSSINPNTGRIKYPNNTNYISVDNNVVKIAYKDGSPISKNEKGYDTLRGINLSSITERSVPVVLSIIEENFASENPRFKSTSMDVSKNQLGRNKKFISISDNGSINEYSSNRHGENTYEGYIKDYVRTNVKSFAIKDIQGNTKWVTDVQPMLYFDLKNNASQNTAQKAVQDTIQEISVLEEKDVKKAIKSVPDDIKEETLRILKGIEGADQLDLNFSRRDFTLEQLENIDSIQSNQISSISPLQQKKLINSLFNLVISNVRLDNSSVNLKDITDGIDSSIETYIKPEIDKIRINKENLEQLNNSSLNPIVDKFNEKISQLESIIEEKDKITSNGSILPKGDLYKKFERFLSEELGSDNILQDENGEMDFSFNMSSLEKDVKLTFSNNLKIFFANVKKQKNETREDIINFAYLNEYESVDNVVNKLMEVMVGLPSSIEDLISILETKKEDNIFNQILNKIKNSSEEVQNEILYKMIQSKLDMHMVLYSYNRDSNAYSLKIINPNSSSSDIKLKQQWNSNFINSDLLRTVEDSRVLNIKPIQALIDNIDSLSNKKLSEEDSNIIKPIFKQLGIEVQDNTIKSLLSSQGNNILTSTGVLGVFKNNLKSILNRNKSNTVISLQDENNNPYNNAKGVIDELVNLELELNGTKISKSFRVGGKSIQGSIQKMMVYDVKENLKDTNSEYFNALKQIPYSKDNYILKFLEGNDKFRNYFDVSFVSLEAIKQNRQKSYNNRKINKLAVTDNMLTQYAFFQNTLRELGEVLPGSNLKFRMGHMFNPSLSDKEQMILYSTALLDLDYKNFDINESTGEVELNNEVLNFITEQIFNSEFNRIISTYSNPTNIKNYDSAAKRFLSIPAFNDIKSNEGANIHDVIKLAANNGQDMLAIQGQFKQQALNVIKSTIKADVSSKVDVTNKKGTWFDNNFLDSQFNISFFDTKYLNSKKKKNKNLDNKKLSQIAAYDFVVNQYLNQNNTYQLIAGDMALYAPNINKFKNKETGNIDNIAFSKALGESITKRMAMLIAPGNKLANSKNDKYLQVFVNDPVKVTSTAREFIKQYYGSVSQKNNELLERLNEIENGIRNLYNSRKKHEKFTSRLGELNNNRDSIMSSLKATNPEIAGYFEIEGTDAQEYTTWKEHLNILFRQGRLTESEKSLVNSAYNKLIKGEEINPEELKVIMNPIKPVYAGNIIHKDKQGKPNVNRTIYIKSSSFPLLPQLTKDFKLDKIRQQLESLENKSGKNVRLSYQSANKVGALTTKLTVQDLYNIPFGELEGKLGESVLELDRNHFKIQQDTPYKTAKYLKKNSDDMTTMGSQMWKIILGNGVNKIDAKVFPHLFGNDLIDNINRKYERKIVPENGMISGKDLDIIKFEVEKMYFDIQKELLYDELGLDRETRRPKDTNETVKLLHKLLQREAVTREYPEGILDNLELTYTREELEFVLPIWLSNGSNKFESLLQSIITNRLIQIDLPGNQLISSSSEGFERVTDVTELDPSIKSQIVWVNPDHFGELKSTIVDGKVKESEVLLQPKFRKTVIVDGKPQTKIIDLTKQPYSIYEDGILKLNKDMIDEELISNFSFRIPTSAHQSGAILKVVGFLPEASGDMLVVPKEHTQQLGEDFDIDKRTLYNLNYNVSDNGKISKLNYSPENKEVENLMYAMMGDNYLSHLATDSDKKKYSQLKTRIKMLENAMVDVYKSVYQSPDNNVQKKINKILSFDNATETANLINDRLNSSKDVSNFTLLSDDYQREQMKLGADGKAGIGIHSNAVTFQAQMERLEKPLTIQDPIYNEQGKLIGYVPKSITIGNYTSKGVLGNIETLDKSRSIADVHTENQNSSTDNIKAQIMGKRNENSYTMNILTQLTFRGFDMDKFSRVTGQKEMQLPSLFISQPIIRRYVELREQNKSITSEFNPNVEQDILETLFKEFGSLNEIVKNETGAYDKTNFLKEENYIVNSKKMTADVLYDNLVNEQDLKTWDSGIQLAVLQKFFVLEEESKHLGKYQSMLNMSTSGLGISYFNVLDRVEMLNDMGRNKSIAGLQDLVGEFVEKDIMETEPELYNIEDFTLIGDFYIKPTTTEGTVLVQSLSSSQDIMELNFPYQQEFIKGTIDNIIDNKDRELTPKQKMDLQYKVISNIRDYIYATENLGLFSNDINSERNRLFFDTEGNDSLATFLKRLSDDRNEVLISNELLRSFVYDGIKRNGSPSIIKHQADYNTNFDRTDKYNAFLELLQDDVTDLGAYNGDQMTPRKLAQDLASYAYLANNENGAIGFRDFVNVKYLNIMDVSKNVRDINKSRDGWNMDSLMNNFEKQFYQHNPEEAKILSPNNISIDSFISLDSESNKKRNQIKAARQGEIDLDPNVLMSGFLKNIKEFTLKEEGPRFISIRNTDLKLTTNQYNLYEFDGVKYVRVPVLGDFGFNEYNPLDTNQKSLIYPQIGENVVSQVQTMKAAEPRGVDLNNILDTSKGVESLLEQIGRSNTRYKGFTERLLPYLDNTVKIKIDAITTSKGVLNAGMYRSSNNTIYLNPDIVNYLISNKHATEENVLEVIEEIVLEEIIHSMTVSELNKYGEMKDGKYVPKENAPIFISKLSKLYEISKQEFPDEYYNQNIFEFVAGAFVDEEFRSKLDSKGLYKKFKDAIASMIRYITGSKYSDEVVNSVYELLENSNSDVNVQNVQKNIMEEIKKEDAEIDLQISTFERQQLDNNIKIKKEYSQDISNNLIQNFNNGQGIIVTPSNKRETGSPEYMYMRDIINSLGENPREKIIIEDVNPNTQIIKKKLSLEDMLKAGKLKSVDNYSKQQTRLPEIKKCKD